MHHFLMIIYLNIFQNVLYFNVHISNCFFLIIIRKKIIILINFKEQISIIHKIPFGNEGRLAEIHNLERGRPIPSGGLATYYPPLSFYYVASHNIIQIKKN